MKLNLKIALITAMAALLAVDAQAQNAKLDLVGSPVLIATSTNNLTIGTASTGDLILKSNDTTRATLDGSTGDLIWESGKGPRYPAVSSVSTPATSLTPVAGASLSLAYHQVATAAPTANFVFLPVATANVGKRISLVNQGANPVAIAPTNAADDMGGATTFSCAAHKKCDCEAMAAGVWGCGS